MLNMLADNNAPILDGHEYPRRWNDYVGQARAKRILQLSAKSARMRKQPLEHILITHPTPGIGKTALAVLLATEMRTNARVTSGQVGRDKARMIFSGMNDGDILFYEEFHQIMGAGRKGPAEWLLSYLQDGVIIGPLGPEEQPKITIVAATTDAHKIPETILSRFLVPPMAEYDLEEAAKIARLMGVGVLESEGLPALSKVDSLSIAGAANCNPRAIRRLLEVLRNLTITEELKVKSGRYDVPGVLDFMEITHDGLDPVMQDYLRTLAADFGGTAGAKAIEDRLQQPGGLATLERTLMDKGLVAKTRTGRSLTQAGIRRYRELEAV